MLLAYILLGLVYHAACGYGHTMKGRQAEYTMTKDAHGSYTTAPLVERTTSFPASSSNAASTQISSLQPSQSVLPASVPPTVACWATPYCDSILVDFAHCYNISGTLKSPNGDDGRSEVYQRCLCNDRGTVYKDILTNYQEQNTDNVTQCYACMKQAGIEVDKNSEPSLQMRYKIHNFCNTAVPNLYDLLALFLVWLKSTDEPVDNNTELGNIPSISTLADRFTKTDVNQATTTVASSARNTETPWLGSTLTAGDVIPTQYLQQLPKHWPYTSYGAARKAGQTTSFPLTDPNSTSQTVAWLFHEMLWNPRPLFTPPSARGEVYEPGLEDWTPVFRNGAALTAIPSTSAAPDISTTNVESSTSDPTATAASEGTVTLSTSMTSTTLSSSTTTALLTTSVVVSTSMLIASSVAILTTTTTTLPPTSSSSPPPPPSSSLTSQALVPNRPEYTQYPVLSRPHDARDVTTASSRMSLVDATAGSKQQIGNKQESIEQLWGEILGRKNAMKRNI